MRPNDPMVSTNWLAENINQSNVLVVDATWSMPSDPEPLPNEFIKGVKFDIDEIANTSAEFAHTLPEPIFFQSKVRELGVNRDTHVICYDRHGLFSAPRAWWMFRVMGHEDVSVLDGGLPAWIGAGHPTTNTYATRNIGNFEASFNESLYRNINDIRTGLNKETILDARPSGRFDGSAPEPRAGLSSGHMPGAANVPFSELKDENGFLNSKSELAQIFDQRNVNRQSPAISTCGSGITACGIALALARLGSWDTAVYDGSWTEWASTENCPIDKVE